MSCIFTRFTRISRAALLIATIIWIACAVKCFIEAAIFSQVASQVGLVGTACNGILGLVALAAAYVHFYCYRKLA